MEDTCNMDTAILEQKLKNAEYVRTIKPKLSYEQFVDHLIESTSRILFLSGAAMILSGLTVAFIKALM